MNTNASTTRRRFLGGILAAGVAPQVIPSRLLAAETAPSNQVQLGHIGVGGRGTAILKNFVSAKGARSIAVCDSYRARREAAGGIVKAAQAHEPKLYNHFRELLADESVDAVVVATPDHWHVPIALEVVAAGKDLYLEKPLGYTLDQNLALTKAVREKGIIFQYGTQQRSQEITRRGIELVLNGYIGELKEVHVWAPRGNGGGSTAEIPVPDGLDYDLYLGPAPLTPCTKDRITMQGSWFCRDYALGFIAGWGAHPLDFAVWGLDYDQQGPVKLKGSGKFPPPTDLFNACTNWDVEIDFGGKVAMRFVSDDLKQKLAGGYLDKIPGDGTTFIGSEGWVSLSRGSASASNPEWLRLRQCEGDRRVVYRPNYYHGFVDTVRERAPSAGPIDDAVRSDALSHLSLMAIESGGEVVWDPNGYRIVSPEALNAKMGTEIRGDWRQS